MLSKWAYEKYIEILNPGPELVREKWNRDMSLELSVEQWQKIRLENSQISCLVKLMDFQYRVASNRLVTNAIRSKWDKVISLMCYFCKREYESIIHLLAECLKSKLFGTI